MQQGKFVKTNKPLSSLERCSAVFEDAGCRKTRISDIPRLFSVSGRFWGQPEMARANWPETEVSIMLFSNPWTIQHSFATESWLLVPEDCGGVLHFMMQFISSNQCFTLSYYIYL